MKLLLVVNPISGGTDKEAFLQFAEKQCADMHLQVFQTSGKGDCKRLQQLIADYQPDRIACAGGDGTFALAARATLHQPIPLGFVPMGSANGFAKELGVSTDPEVALADLINSTLIVPMDMLVVNDKHLCLHLGDVGVNARIVEAFDSDERRGFATYGKHLISALSESLFFTFHLQTNVNEISGKAKMIGIGNGTRYGSGVPLNTVGSPFDGKFEVTVIEDMDADTIIRAGLSVIDDTFLDEAAVQVYSATSAVIRFKPAQLLQLDGEVIGETDVVKIEIKPGAIPLITTVENPYLKSHNASS